MRSEIYKKVSDQLFKIAQDGSIVSDEDIESGAADGVERLIKYVDLWNHNVEFIEQETMWPMPAVFIEFAKVPWKPLSGAKDYKTNSQLILHIVTSWQGSAASGSPAKDEMLAVLDYSGYIQKVLTGLKGEAFCNLALSETNTNHNHEDILENIDVYNYTGNITL